MEKERVSKEITPKGDDWSQWYLDVVLKTDLVDYGPVKGCMVMKPYGYAVWENMQADMDRRIKDPAFHKKHQRIDGEHDP